MHKIKIISISLLSLALVILAIVLSQPEQNEVLDHPVSEKATAPVPDFAEYTNVTEKKKAFFDYLRPEVEAQNAFILRQRDFVHAMRAKHIASETITEQQQEQLATLLEDYRVEETPDKQKMFSTLLRRVDIIPVELVLVQTANESAWGTSRFARQGYNFFGLWCFKKGCGFVPKRRNKGAAHEVAKFDDLSSAMHSYMLNLNRHNAYTDLRRIRQNQRDNMKTISAKALTEGLHKYSERGDEYIKELQQMIRVNKDLMNDEV
jgi:Bax protein